MCGNWANIALSGLGERFWNYLLIEKKGIFLIKRAAVSCGEKCWVLRIDPGFAVPHCQLWAGGWV